MVDSPEAGTPQKKKSRDDLRTAFFTCEDNKAKVDTIQLNGVDIEFRQPTIGTLNQLSEDFEGKTLAVMALIRFGFIPGTDEKFFDDADYDAIVGFAPTAEVRDAFSKVNQMLGYAIEEKEKN